jgi:8-oxo-dGTP pyrophosphatase MutT (NUDIX family)
MANGSDYIRQAAAIPAQSGKICLVTSRSGKRWIVPKGVIDPGKTAEETALQESWEEAGLVGILRPQPVGSYTYEKWGATCWVTVFIMHVTKVAVHWPEEESRQREWVAIAEALERIGDPALAEIVRTASEAAGLRKGTLSYAQ